MQIQSVFDKSFAPYGKVLEGLDFAPLVDALCAHTPKPADGTVYVPSEPALETLPLFDALTNNVYGGMPVQAGYCNGHNKALNCLEYHRDSEINVAADDVVLLVAQLQKAERGSIDTAEVEAFLLPAGTAAQLYETTLHYAPCTAPGAAGFRVAVVLPRGTNTEMPAIAKNGWEDELLRARNKWLMAHPDSNEAKQGAFVGLTGKNIVLD